MPQEQVLQLFNDLSNSDPVIKSIIDSVESAGVCSTQKNVLSTLALSGGPTFGDCEYTTAPMPTWVTAAYRYTPYSAKPYKVDRMKNDPNEKPCDFRLYVTPRNYREVDGLSWAAWYVVSYHGGLSGSLNHDRYIVGGGSAYLYGVPFEWYLRDYIIFRT